MSKNSDEIDLAKSVGSVVHRRRKELGWSQRQLHQALSASGAKWSRASVGVLETDGVRGERISDLALLCYVLNLTLDELLAGDHDVRLRDGNVKPLPWVRDCLSGEQTIRFKPANAGVQPDKTDERKLADYIRSAASMTDDDLSIFVKGISAMSEPEMEPSVVAIRDALARLTPEMSKATVQSRRGHAARKLRDFAITYKSHGTTHVALIDLKEYLPHEVLDPDRVSHGDD